MSDEAKHNKADSSKPAKPEKQEKSEKQDRPKDAAIGSGFKEQKLGNVTDATLIKRLWTFMRPYRFTFLLCLLLLPVLAGFKLVQPHLLQVAIDDYLVPGEYGGLTWVIAAFGAAVFLQAGTGFLQFYLMQKAGQRALYDLRQKVFDHVQSLSVNFFHRHPTGRLMTRMTTDVESLQEALSSGMITMIGDIIMLVGIVVILLLKDWKLALVSFTVVPFLAVLTAIFRHFLRKAFREIRVKIARLYAHLQESVTGIEIIQLFVRENVSAEEYRDINEDYRDANVLSIRYDAMLYAVVEAVGAISVGAIIWYGSGQVLDDILTIGVLVAFIEYMQKFFVPIRDLAQKYNLLQSAMASSERIFELLDSDDQIPQPDNPKPLPDEPLHIEFENVWFAYNDDEWVIKDLSFEVKSCEKVALVGHTGAGKTTIISLLMRLYDVTRGRILINGIDIREFDLHAYRRAFAAVLQDSFLFQGSIRENLTLGEESITDDELVEAAKIVHAHPLISRYADDYDHRIAERGSNLSSGEKQLLSFARALVQKPEILILDEATANVDTDTEAIIQDAIDKLMARQTSVVIAHRLSTIQKADRIIVLHKGEIMEQGTHHELLEHGGHYETLYRLQYAFDADAQAAE
ncbi:ABC transporter ATP-binding protein [Persicimonas caeni]|uniref:ABC transporter ATP-binding protein n=1 Tax=Persicimonas caeni TaxID=2292766 RepID=A0A4Y6Q2C8_PERCE|nr:ABC transporter ATP-binding protein [Persicimonas caeni]QDG54744.1 ABC transporter ATP-binding protein [Persicimonas caeni]QED35965.1 ABC transporter ATP-binding protein [Persicimonas caeni]